MTDGMNIENVSLKEKKNWDGFHKTQSSQNAHQQWRLGMISRKVKNLFKEG